MGATTLTVTIAGVDRTANVRNDSVVIRDIRNEAPNQAQFVCLSTFKPTKGQDVQITLGTASPLTIFGGTILEVEQAYEDTTDNAIWSVDCLDYTYLLNRRNPLKSYGSQSATAIVQNLVSTFSSGFTSTNVAAALPSLAIDFDGSQNLAACLTQVATAIGGYWYVDYAKDVHFFLTEATAAPDPIDAGHPILNDPPLSYRESLAQIRTRVFVDGVSASVNCGAGQTVAAGAATVPLSGNFDTTPFSASGGLAKAGAQRFTYTGLINGSSASAPNVPASAPTVTSGANGFSRLTLNGLYGWKVTYVNAAGEGLPSAAGTVTMTTSGDMTAAAPTGLAAVNAVGQIPGGVFNWAVTFRTAIGETARGTASGNFTVAAYAAVNVSSLSANDYGGVKGASVYGYKATVVTADGESTLGSALTITPGTVAAPSAPSLNTGVSGGNLTNGRTYTYRQTTYHDDYGESDFSSASAGITATSPNLTIRLNIAAKPTNASGVRVYRAYGSNNMRLVADVRNGATTLDDGTADDSTGDLLDTIGCGKRVTVGVPTSSEPGVIARRIYRTVAGGSEYFLVGELQDNVTTSFVDMIPDKQLVQRAPAASTLGRQISMTVPTGPVGTIARDIYRTRAGGSVYYLVGELKDNSTTAFTDNAPDASLSLIAPSTNTAGSSQTNTAAVLPRISLSAGPTGTLARRIYRTAAGGSEYRLVGQVSDNTTTFFDDNTDDGGLADGAPLTNAVGAFLTGCSGIVNTLQQGDAVAISVQRDDAAAQTALAALEGGDGIHEHQIDDTSLDTVAKITARGDAELTLFKSPIVQVTYATRDTKSRSGKSVSITLGAPQSLSGTFTIQEVEIRDIDVAANVLPTFVVTASSVRFSLEDLLRRLEVAA